MSVFCYKTLPPAVRLGERLRGERERQGFSWNDVTVKTRLPQKFLEAMESGAFSQLPKSKGYRLAYVKEYAEILGLNRDEAVAQMIREAGLEDAPQVHPAIGVRHFPFASLMSAARTIGALALVAVFAGYLFWQVRGIVEPPRLTVFTPMEESIVTTPSIIIQGEATQAIKLMVNGQDIMLNERGTFETTVDLTSGVNTITISANKKYGKTTTVVRHVVVRPGKGPVGLNEMMNSDRVGL